MLTRLDKKHGQDPTAVPMRTMNRPRTAEELTGTPEMKTKGTALSCKAVEAAKGSCRSLPPGGGGRPEHPQQRAPPAGTPARKGNCPFLSLNHKTERKTHPHDTITPPARSPPSFPAARGERSPGTPHRAAPPPRLSSPNHRG